VTDNTEQNNTTSHVHYTKRDAETQTAIGLFVTYISLPVIAGTFWAQTVHAKAVEIIAGLVLLSIGIAIIVWGRKTARKASD
jgi:putative Ca2+/H+ antiporter (TMEM165/GDT1 family)